uniref:Uncharacterized protein n=1 Tax=Oryza brachyantha TaxID=4533 RepID=J3M3J7_ORYBR
MARAFHADLCGIPMNMVPNVYKTDVNYQFRVKTPVKMEFWIALLLTILGYLPGIIYAVYVLVA